MSTNQTALETWADAITESFNELGAQFIGFIPNLIAALIIFFLGWAIAVAIGRLIEKLLVILRVNAAFEGIKGLKQAVEQGGLRLNIAKLVGEIFKWFIIIVALLAATDILGLGQVAIFLEQVLLYIPNVIIAALILIIAVLLANFTYKTVLASVESAGFTSGGAIASISKWAILIFGLAMALSQLGIATNTINTFISAFAYMITIAGGLAFGLGGKDLASKWLGKIEHDLTGRKKS